MASTSATPMGLRRVVLLIADISGYTRFMVANATALAHGQAIITELLEAILRQIDTPLQVAKLEGDAAFLYAVRDDSSEQWRENRARIAARLPAFFDAFAERLAQLGQAKVCACDACRGIGRLQLKLVVHSGEALFHDVAGSRELAGVDVILVHRLLKNSVAGHEYLLLTEAAWRDLELPDAATAEQQEERYDEIGAVKVFVLRRGPAERRAARERARRGPWARGALFAAIWLWKLGTRQVAFHLRWGWLAKLRGPGDQRPWPVRWLQAAAIVVLMPIVFPALVLLGAIRALAPAAAGRNALLPDQTKSCSPCQRRPLRGMP